ncbi:transglycosylase family protein [Saccharopolyspora elongata]|uniref:LysM peptidoglycan-binding domain-containing protein n=1 Tax=Saccharopolyspora elongata TaxID=2530387 RepID=A0A4R4YX19_9PSEU|nr:transglycosylase family protein [Saccharopolyspora elongata]TDD49460.1 LysM peptidoglycan-binding domain-containing protein [Saccharopolyspora elongata]
MARYQGKHRKPSNTGRTLARVAVAGAVVATPIAIAAPANAAPNWDKLAQCESSGNWSINSGNGYYGGLQFSASTWAAYGGTQYASSAHQATREQQIAVAEKVLASQGANAWPGCTSKLNWTSGGTKVTAKVTTKTTTPKKTTETKVKTQTPKPTVKTNGADYTVQLGDTLSKIGEQFGVTYQDIAQRNSSIINDPNLIFPGQQLDIK